MLRANLLLMHRATKADLERALEAVDLTDWLAAEKGRAWTRLSAWASASRATQRQLAWPARSPRSTSSTRPRVGVDQPLRARVREGIAHVATAKIAHRISCARRDQTIVMDGGRVVKTGTYAELHARGGALALGRAKPPSTQRHDRREGARGDGATASSTRVFGARYRFDLWKD